MLKPDNDLEMRVARYISSHSLLDVTAGPVVVGLSGGADSVALLAMLTSLGYECVAVHCNFHLRGMESDRDMNHAVKIGRSLCEKVHVEHFDIPGWQRQNGGSVEMACRDTRYALFGRIMEDTGAQAVAVAHHREDNLETVLHNLMRGTGIAGLTGMAPRRGHVVRPFLDLSREDIENYLQERNIGYVVDSSNLSNDYARNRIRNILTPALLQVASGALNGILNTVDTLRETERFYRQSIERVMSKYVSDKGVDLKGLNEEPDAGLVLFEYMRQSGVSRRMSDDMLATCEYSGRVFKSHDHVWINDHGFLREQADSEEITTDFPFLIEMIAAKDMHPVSDASVAYLDATAIDAGLSWRYWEEGDRMHPFGMKGSKKVSDLMRDAHIPTDKKKHIPFLVTAKDEILFIPGVRASKFFAVTPETETVLRVKLF